MKYDHFGVMLDVSRNAVMKVDEIKKFVDLMVKAGYDSLQLYAEDIYAVKDEPFYGYLRGRYSAEEIKEIDSYCREKGVELIPCIQTLAHFTNSAKLPRFAPIIDTADILLVGEEETYKFIERIFATLKENFTSRKVNIGMDEAHMIGLGEYLNRHGLEDRMQILIKHLNRVVAIAEKYGFYPIMWSDMFIRLVNNGIYNTELDEEKSKKIAEIRSGIPNVGLCYWDYYNQDKKVYDANFNTHKILTDDVWFAGGAWSWNGFAPLNDFALRTMRPAMKSVRENGVKNVFITMWGDDGKECSFFSLLPSLFYIRKLADGTEDEQTIKEEFYKTYGISYDAMLTLDLPNYCNGYPKGKFQCPSKVMLYNDCFAGMWDPVVEKEGVIDYSSHVEKLKSARKEAKEFSYLFDSAISLCKALQLKYDLGVRTRKAYKSGDKKQLKKLSCEYFETAKRVKKFTDDFRTLWFKENKAFGWEIQEIRLGGLKARIEECGSRLKNYASGRLDRIDELEEEVIALSPEQDLQYNVYRRLVSPSEL